MPFGINVVDMYLPYLQQYKTKRILAKYEKYGTKYMFFFGTVCLHMW